jgi:hypothetical protein
MDLDEILMDMGYDDWETDGFGLDSNLIAPDGCTIEQDGQCPHGYVSPLRELGMI